MQKDQPTRVGRRLAAIVAADVAGYSRLMGLDEVGTARALREHRKVTDALVEKHGGRLVKSTGDGVLLEFPSVVDAVECAVAVQAVMAERNQGVPEDRRMLFRIGVNLGDILIEGDDILGDGVNIAARLEGIAEPGGICISSSAYDQVCGKVTIEFADLGEQRLKNIERPMRVYAVNWAEPAQMVASVTTLHRDAQKPLLPPDKPSIAVLPFQNMSGDTEQEYFSEGIVEDIITALSRFKSLFVIARNSSFTYKGKAVDIKKVGRELGVRYVLEGSVRKAGNRVRITAQLIDAQRDTHLWADKFEGSLDDVFELQDRVTSSVVGIIAPRIEWAEIEGATAKPTNNLQAYDWYLRGMAGFDRPTSDGMRTSIQCFKNAVAIDAKFAGAMAGIGVCHAVRALQGWLADPVNDAAEAMHYALLAQQTGSNDADVLARSAMTMNIWNFNADLDMANALADRAISLNPNQALGWAASGWIKRSLGHHQLAIDHFSRALQLNPFDPANSMVVTSMAWAHFLLSDYANTEKVLQRALAESPKHLPALRLKAILHAALGEHERARQMMGRIIQINPGERISNINVVRLSRRLEERTKVTELLRIAGMPE